MLSVAVKLMKKETQDKAGSDLNYFHPNRTQPFLITFFQAVLAFKRVCRLMKLRMGFRKPPPAAQRRRSSTFQAIIRKSREEMEEARMGKPVLVPPAAKLITQPSSSSLFVSPPKSNPEPPGPDSQIAETRLLDKQVSSFLRKHVVQARAEALTERLEAMSGRQEKKAVSLNSHKQQQGGAEYFKHFAHSMLAEDFDENSTPAIVMDYLSGSAIYFGATIALQARHGGFLSFNPLEVKASAHKILNNSRLVVKKSDDLTDCGVMTYGDALWLQAGANYVLGATYGNLVDKKREIQPALVSCKRQSMFKARQYGRWIVLNREDPMGTLGKPVGHLDRIILEQEWTFLASASPYESSMYKSVSNSDEAMHTKIDLFQPSDECSWRIHLVALPSGDRENERQRQKLLQKAKEQIDRSEASRYRKSNMLLGSLEGQLSPNLQVEHLVNSTIQHKYSIVRNQEHLRKMYRQMAKTDFQGRLGTERFLERVYGKDSPIVNLHHERQSLLEKGSCVSSESVQSAHSVSSSEEQRKELQQTYWRAAESLRLSSDVWKELPHSMACYYRDDADKKAAAVQVLQKWVRRLLSKRFDYERIMRRIDTDVRGRLEDKQNERRRLIMQHTESLELLMVPAGSSISNPTNRDHSSRPASAVTRRSSKLGTLPTRNNPLRSSRSVSRAGIFDEEGVVTPEQLALRETIAQALSVYFPLDSSVSPTLETRSKSISRLPSFVSNQISVFSGRPQTASTIEKKATQPLSSSGVSVDVHRRPATASRLQRISRNFAEEGSWEEKLLRDKQRLGRSADRKFGLPADVFVMPITDAYERNAGVGLRFLKTMSKSGVYSDVRIKRRQECHSPLH